MTKSIKPILQYLFFFGLGFLFVWLSIKDINAEKWEQIKQAIANAKYILVIPVLFILLLSHYVRAQRWRLLIEPLGYQPDRMNIFFSVMIGYLVNQGVPRLGEVLRCTVLAKYEKIPVDKLVGTIILERLFDAVCLLIVFGITIAVQPGLYTQIVDRVFSNDATAEKAGTNLSSLLFLVIAGLIIVVVLLWMIVKKKTFSDIIQLGKKITLRILEGLTSIRRLQKKGQFILLTILMWCLYLAGGWIGFHALQETAHYGIKEAFSILSAGSIGMIISPGGIGGYALLIERTMVLYGLQQSIAAAFGWMLWIVQTFVVLLGGLLSFSLLPGYNKFLSGKKATRS